MNLRRKFYTAENKLKTIEFILKNKMGAFARHF